ncbi:hypothetical protein E2P81_ATG09648 [Venturia nashicola]|uniref:Uncharacterized protein n=1 Tax=Venturia nashicola TaxID=86259 RepID=A0A4Z1NNA7_9PEZI|nr:hypothetical protein E6O75_ATG09859 [Venturia nashicola]TLD25991.1 hypothetical protein E2P81_ATG09648 [Venturia nashicola]
MPLFRRGSSEPFDAVRFSSSWLFSPLVLCILRANFSAYIFACIITIFILDAPTGESGYFFSYFTDLTFCGLAFYFAFAALHSGSYARTGTPLLARWPRFLQILHSIFYSTITIFPFLVTIVYWAIIFGGFANRTGVWRNISVHGLNSFFAMFEIIFPRTDKTPGLHIVPLILILAGYLGIAYLTLHNSGFYVYDFLDETTHSKGIVAGYIMGILAAIIIVFVLVHFVIRFRRWLTEDKLGKRGRFSSRQAYVPNDVERGVLGKQPDIAEHMAEHHA